MCGIAGFCDFSKKYTLNDLGTMTNSLHYRGPDDDGNEVFNLPNCTVGLGHRRLAIIDLSPLGHQPMHFENLHIVFNGEIYNFKEVKKQLEQLNYKFNSESDTEVILKAYHAWGVHCVQKFIGMFAISLLDTKKNELTLIRDRAGVKPLYWYNECGVFLFSSELKAFHSGKSFKGELDLAALGQYFQYGYIPAPLTIFKNARKLKPGHFLKINLNNQQIVEESYWNVLDFYNKPKLNLSMDEAIDETEKLLISACNYRMVADVPVGVFLSGGYDSSTVAALLQNHSGQKIKTFSIGFFEDEFNEAKFAKQIAEQLGLDHHEHYCSVNEAKAIIPKLPFIYDEPFGDSSAIPTTLVSQMAVKHVKVALSADAGDEIFAGYDNYFYFLQQYNRFKKIPEFGKSVLTGLMPMARLIGNHVGRFAYNVDTRLGKIDGFLKSADSTQFNAVINQYFTEYEVNRLIPLYHHSMELTSWADYVDTGVNDFLNLQLAIGYKTFLVDDILTKVDRATMSVSLEGREPMLDHRLIEFVSQLPSDFKYHQGQSKYILKQIAHKYIPKPLINRPKMGFSIPLEKWLREDLVGLLHEYLSKDKIKNQGILDPLVVDGILKNFLKGYNFNFAKIWFLLMFQMWAEVWLEGSSKAFSEKSPVQLRSNNP